MWPGSGDAQGLTLRIFFFLTEKKKSDFCVTVGKKKKIEVWLCVPVATSHLQHLQLPSTT